MNRRKYYKFKAELKCLKRINGLSIPNKVKYLASTAMGEAMRTRIFSSFGLRLVEISLTDQCQCRCRHCFAATQQPLPKINELSTHEVKALVDELSELKVSEVCFSGGEPLMRLDILDIISHAHSKGLVTRLITNGILLDENMVIELKHAGVNWCSVSIDNPKAEVHDTFRGYSGCFEKAINGLTLLVKHKVPCSIIAVARKELINSGELNKIVDIGKKIGVTVVRINFPVPIGRYINQDNEVLNLEEREMVRELLLHGNVVMENPSENTKCTAAVTKVNILPNGDVTPCVFVPLSYGNIREKKFFDIWTLMAEYNSQFKVNGECPMCDSNLRELLFKAADMHQISN